MTGRIITNPLITSQWKAVAAGAAAAVAARYLLRPAIVSLVSTGILLTREAQKFIEDAGDAIRSDFSPKSDQQLRSDVSQLKDDIAAIKGSLRELSKP